jgi:hypothetical protein
MLIRDELIDRGLGALLGLAVGDAALCLCVRFPRLWP